jgi:hypothetical protein
MAKVRVTYCDDKNEYNDEFIFDLKLDNWRLVDTSDLAQIRKQLKEIAKHTKEIANHIKEKQGNRP